ncbi:MAG TPA: rhodanese-like domain-containing protein [candidate division Zixibacteria bacterium]
MKPGLSSSWKPVFMLIVVLMVMIEVSCMAQSTTSKLVSTTWLKANLTQADIRIIDLRQDVKDYWQAHIPGAVYFNPEALRLADEGVPVKLMPPEAIAIMLGKMGIDENTHIIIYAEQNDFKAPYLIWALDYIGHPQASILDGGFSQWQKENLPVTQDYPKIKAVDYSPSSKINQDVRANLDDVKEMVNRGGAVLLDVRPVEMYNGEKGNWKRTGHIPGAINHFWGDDLNADGTWKSTEALKQAYEEIGATPDKLIIVSCGQGLMSASVYFVLKHILGYPRVKNYDGGFNEWSNSDTLPVEKSSGGPSFGVPASMPTGAALVAERCTKCHDQKRINKQKLNQAGWEKLVNQMIHRGAKLSPEEHQLVVDYLSSR